MRQAGIWGLLGASLVVIGVILLGLNACQEAVHDFDHVRWHQGAYHWVRHDDHGERLIGGAASGRFQLEAPDGLMRIEVTLNKGLPDGMMAVWWWRHGSVRPLDDQGRCLLPVDLRGDVPALAKVRANCGPKATGERWVDRRLPIAPSVAKVQQDHVRGRAVYRDEYTNQPRLTIRYAQDQQARVTSHDIISGKAVWVEYWHRGAFVSGAPAQNLDQRYTDHSRIDDRLLVPLLNPEPIHSQLEVTRSAFADADVTSSGQPGASATH